MTKHEDQFLISADEALQLLIEGNERFQRGEVRISQFSTEILGELAKGQKPFATILGCSDSRVAPEIIFVRWIRFSWTRDWGIIRDQGEPGDGKRA